MPSARLLAVEPLSGAVQRLDLDVGEFRFDAGQYLELVVDPYRIPLSIASAPSRLPRLELHYRSTPGDPAASALDTRLTERTPIDFEGPYGNIVVNGPSLERLALIAGGTGIAQAISIIETLSACAQQRSVRLIWSLATPADQYGSEALDQAEARDWFHPTVVCDTDSEATDGKNAAVRLIEAGIDVAGEFLLCGAPGFVYACADALLAAGAERDQIRSDVFDYAPRADWSADS